MNHLDEGTIHAWLDGAVDAAQSREIEAHVAGCAACSAAVAEARGLIAGASRILGALDDVPAGVIPGAAARTAARPKGRGQRWVAGWVSGIAAVLVGAVVLSNTHVASRMTDMSQPTAGLAFDSAVPTASPGEEAARAAEPVVQPAAPPAAVPAPQRAVQKTSVASEPRDPATKATKAVGAATGTAGAAESRDLASAATTDTTRMRREAVSEARPQTVDSARVRRLGEGSTRLSEVVVTSVAAEAALSDADVERFAGCYRFEAPVEIAEQRTPTTGAVANTARRGRAAAPAQAPPAAAAESRADFSARDAAPLVRLDTALVAGQRRAVRIPSDSVVGFWLAAHDSVRIDLGSRGAVTLSPLQRVSCP